MSEAKGGFCRQPLSRGEGFGERVTERKRKEASVGMSPLNYIGAADYNFGPALTRA